MLRQVMEAYEMLDGAKVTGDAVAKTLQDLGLKSVTVKTVQELATTQFIKGVIPGSSGKAGGGKAPTLGVIGNLGGVGARPKFVGLVSDADGAIAALAVALKLLAMQKAGDFVPGDVIVTTHICPDAPTIPHEPVHFMGNPTRMAITKTRNYSDSNMDAIVHVETSRGNRVINCRGFAITPTIKECYVLRVSNDLMDIMQNVTGELPRVVPITTQDVTPYDNGLYHTNGMAQDTVVSDAPIVGVALTSVIPVPGCATGASQIQDIELAARFVVEVAKGFTAGTCKFYDEAEFKKLIALYGPMTHLRKF